MKTVSYAVIAWLLCSFQISAQPSDSRLIAKARWAYNSGKLVPVDSIYLAYSTDNMLSVSRGECRYDTSTRVSINATGMKNQERAVKKYIGVNVVEQTNEEWLNLSWRLRNKLVYNYDVNKLISITYAEPGAGTSWRALHKDSNVYDATDRLIEVTHLVPSGATWGNVSRKLFNYAGTGQLERVSPYEWNSGTGGWKEQLQTSYYYADNKVIALVHRFADGAADSNVYAYDEKGNLIEDRRYQSISAAQWEPAYKFLYTYDTVGNQISMTVLLPDMAGTYINKTRLVTVYNNAGQPLKEIRYGWNEKTQQFDRLETVNRFYYEGYREEATGDLIQVPGSIQLCPNPASNTLHLNLKWNEIQSATVVLFDIKGTVAGQWTIPAVVQYLQALDISNVASGNYILKIMGTRGQLSKQVTIVRQYN